MTDSPSGSPSPSPRPREAVRRTVVRHVLASLDFRRSREASRDIVDDPESLRDLAESVRDRGYDEQALEPVADQIDAALHLIDDRAEQLDDAREQRAAAGAEAQAVLPPARAARHRLIVAAMHYLTRRPGRHTDDVERAEADTDTVVVVTEVLGSAQVDLEPYLEDGGAGDTAARGGPVSGGDADSGARG